MDNFLKYTFSKTVKIQGSKYIYQYVKNRKLTDVPHYHDFYELCFVIRGSCTEVHNGRCAVINENSISVSVPGDFHYFREQSENLIFVCLSVEKDEFLKMANAVSPDVIDYIEKYGSKRSFALLGSTHGTLYKNPFLTSQHDLDYKYLLTFLLMNIAKTMIFGEGSEKNEFAEKIASLNASELVSGGVEALEKISGYSRSQLTRLMKKNFGKTPWEYINDIRMNYAYNRLAFTDMKTGSIAEKCGFESLGHFSNSFKRKFGETPSEIRKKHYSSTV